jgi:inorganic pyrophosphatase
MRQNAVSGASRSAGVTSKCLSPGPPLAAKPKSVQVTIETPKGSRNKYAFDPARKDFRLKQVLPEGMDFPSDFGFIPATKADDGDPIDVLVLMDEGTFPGCRVDARLVGVIEGEQIEHEGETIRNDRLVAVAEESHLYRRVRTVKDLDPKLLEQFATFFVNFHALEGKSFRVLEIRGPAKAAKLLRQARTRKR